MSSDVKTRRYNTRLRQEQARMTRQRILDAARRLLTAGSYSTVTMGEIARDAGVAPQTVYAVFGTKQRLAEALIEEGFPHVAAVLDDVADAQLLEDPEAWLHTMAGLHRRIFEPCADLIRFTRDSGDPILTTHYRAIEQSRYERVRRLAELLERSGRLRPTLSADEAVAVAWTMLGPDYYTQLVHERGWSPDRYEAWVAQTLIDLFLSPPSGAQSPEPNDEHDR